MGDFDVWSIGHLALPEGAEIQDYTECPYCGKDSPVGYNGWGGHIVVASHGEGNTMYIEPMTILEFNDMGRLP